MTSRKPGAKAGVDYATVAMRFSLIDKMVERASGRTVEGGDARRSHGAMDFHARARRRLAVVGDPAILTAHGQALLAAGSAFLPVASSFASLLGSTRGLHPLVEPFSNFTPTC